MTETVMLPSRRSLIRGAAGLSAGLLAAPALIRPSFAAKTITVADPGGPYGPGYRKAFYDPFEKETGIRVANVAREAEPTAQFKAMVETKSYIWDVCTLTVSARDILAKQKLLEPIGFDSVPGFMADGVTPLWLGIDVYSTIQAYRTDKFKTKTPASWADFWNVKEFPGRRALRKNPIDTLEQALLADGVALDKLYPLDVDRAFKSLDKIKQSVDVWWTSGAQSSQLIQSGEIELIAMWNARAQAAIDGGAPVKIVWNQGLYSIEGWGIPRGSPNAEPARQFVKFCTDPKRQAVFTEFLAYGPTNLDAYKSIPPARAPILPTYEDNLKRMTIAKEDWWSANRAAANERFNSWILN